VSDREVGIDIQQKGELKMNVARRFCTENECKHILAQPDSTKATDMFYRLWSLKESFVKAIGTGTNLSFSSFEIVPGEKAEVIHNYNKKQYEFVERDVDNYKLAVCVEC
ncbi:MAG: 4'-phosphopantetheinyl transferase superfamily protein, partial [Lachnospiraceae bacterium]|nr:4'-phosphopantetheinyl transferase superfamily protein [Lachnospiraceae bacterium]